MQTNIDYKENRHYKEHKYRLQRKQIQITKKENKYSLHRIQIQITKKEKTD